MMVKFVENWRQADMVFYKTKDGRWTLCLNKVGSLRSCLTEEARDKIIEDACACSSTGDLTVHLDLVNRGWLK